MNKLLVSRRAIAMSLLWALLFTAAWVSRSRPQPAGRVPLARGRSLISVSESGLAATIDGYIDTVQNPSGLWSTLQILDLKTGQRVPSPIRDDDQPLSVALLLSQDLAALNAFFFSFDVRTKQKIQSAHWA